jgi:hypothetical protein
MKVYILKIWGVTHSIHRFLKDARMEARRVGEPTSDDMQGTYFCQYGVELWEEGKTKATKHWVEEFTIKYTPEERMLD